MVTNFIPSSLKLTARIPVAIGILKSCSTYKLDFDSVHSSLQHDDKQFKKKTSTQTLVRKKKVMQMFSAR